MMNLIAFLALLPEPLPKPTREDWQEQAVREHLKFATDFSKEHRHYANPADVRKWDQEIAELQRKLLQLEKQPYQPYRLPRPLTPAEQQEYRERRDRCLKELIEEFGKPKPDLQRIEWLQREMARLPM